jgi:hypothetical protein
VLESRCSFLYRTVDGGKVHVTRQVAATKLRYVEQWSEPITAADTISEVVSLWKLSQQGKDVRLAVKYEK